MVSAGICLNQPLVCLHLTLSHPVSCQACNDWILLIGDSFSCILDRSTKWKPEVSPPLIPGEVSGLTIVLAESVETAEDMHYYSANRIEMTIRARIFQK